MIFVFHFLLFEGVAVAITPALFEFNHRTNQMNQTLHCASCPVHLVSSGDKKKKFVQFVSFVDKKMKSTDFTDFTDIVRCLLPPTWQNKPTATATEEFATQIQGIEGIREVGALLQG